MAVGGTDAGHGRRRNDRPPRSRHRRRQRVAAVALLIMAIAAVVVVARSMLDRHGSAAAPALAAPVTPRGHRHGHGSRARVPIVVRGRAARHMPVPILVYHVIAPAPPGTPFPQLWVPPRAFAEQMRALARAGYHAITLGQTFQAWAGHGGFPRHPIVVSFDDGYRSDYTRALPVLRRLGWPGVLNLELRNIGRGGITARQVRALLAAHWELASHTIDHPDLTTVSDAVLHHELVESRRELQRRFHVAVAFFCYPAGRYDARVVAAVRAAGYRGATTMLEGVAKASAPFTLPRIRVNAADSAAQLRSRLRSAMSP